MEDADMPKYFAVPYLNENLVKIYDTTGATFGQIALNRPGVNCVVYFSDPSASQQFLFISYDEFDTAGSATSHIDIYNVTNIANPTLSSSLALTNAVCGMAVQPGTMDLYVATFTDDVINGAGSTSNPGGVFSFTHSSGYSQASLSVFTTYNDAWNAVASVCANLAFDMHGYLWMTTYQNGDTSPTSHFLICFTQVNRTAGSSKNFFKLTNGGQIPVTDLSVSQSQVQTPLYPLSEPHGIAFDPLGNLWMANNSDDTNANGNNASGACNGTLLRLDRSWIDTALLTNSTLLMSLTSNGFGGTQTIPAATGVSLYGFADGRLGGLSFDGFALYISDQSSSNPYHQFIWELNTQGVTASTQGPAIQIKQSEFTTTYPGNSTIAIFNTTPAKLLARDTKTDTGAEPDAVFVCWESPDIGVTNTAIPSLPAPNTPTPTSVDLTSYGSVVGGGTGFVYVRVANFGGPGDPATTGTEIVKVYWAKASAGLDWPAPWDGLTFDANSTPANSLKLGDLIGAQPVGLINPGDETIFAFNWNVPNTAQYSVSDGHFCLIARVERNSLYPFGMDYPEEVGVFSAENEKSVGDNTRNNDVIGWRNVAVLAPMAMQRRLPIHLGVIGANLVTRQRVIRFAVETLNREGLTAHIPGQFTLHATGRCLHRLLEQTPQGHADHHLGEGRFALHDLSILMHENEVLPFEVVFEPAGVVHDFAIRIAQYAETQHGPKLLGGQTFVIGKVVGLHA
jgi:hypothetical protein